MTDEEMDEASDTISEMARTYGYVVVACGHDDPETIIACEGRHYEYLDEIRAAVRALIKDSETASSPRSSSGSGDGS